MTKQTLNPKAFCRTTFGRFSGGHSRGSCSTSTLKVTRPRSDQDQIAVCMPLIGTGTPRDPATCGTHQGDWKRRFAPALRAGGLALSQSIHPEVELRANLKSISHRCHLFEVAFVWELTKETIHLPLGCLQGGLAHQFEAPELLGRSRVD